MRTVKKAKLLRLHFGESDRYHGKPLYEAIVNRCRELRIAGATVFRGLEGYGETAEIHHHHLIKKDQPVVVTIVDTPENLGRLIPIGGSQAPRCFAAWKDTARRRKSTTITSSKRISLWLSRLWIRRKTWGG